MTDVAVQLPEPLTRGENVVVVVAGTWMIAGLFLDGLAHVELQPESFFTPWHLVLYSGFAAAAVAGGSVVVRRRTERGDWCAAVPPGHGLTLAGIAVFGSGAVADLVWHETLGVEVSNEALLSPTHLWLMVGAILTLSGPLRDGWRQLDETAPIKAWLPAVGSVVLVLSVVVFFTSYLSPFGRVSAAQWPTTRSHTHELARLGPEAFAQLREVWGLAGVLLTSVLLTTAVLLLTRSQWPPQRAITLTFVGMAVVIPSLGEFSQWWAGAALIAAGISADRVAARTHSRAITSGTAVFVTWSAYFIGAALNGSLQWSPALWAGSITMGALTAAALGYIATPARALTAPSS